MRESLRALVGVALFQLATAPCAWAGAPFTWDHSDLSQGTSFFISSFVIANDFQVASGPAIRITGALVWLADGVVNDNGELDCFDSALSWAIYTDSSGAPGAIGTSGYARNLAETDTGFQDSFGQDVVRVRFDFSHPVTLTPGAYWFALHEGLWLTASDGTECGWQQAGSLQGMASASAQDEENPGGWLSPSPLDSAFVLFGDDVIWDQSAVVTNSSGSSISSFVSANDFALAAPASFSSIETWWHEYGTPDDDRTFDGFSGTVGWALYSDFGGSPAILLDSGSSSEVEFVDSGLQTPSDDDVWRIRVALGRSVALGPATYWLALHEGAWGSPYDNTALFWYWGTSSFGAGAFADDNPESPGEWGYSSDQELAFTLSHQLLFASGFEDGVTCAWSNGIDLDCL